MLKITYAGVIGTSLILLCKVQNADSVKIFKI